MRLAISLTALAALLGSAAEVQAQRRGDGQRLSVPQRRAVPPLPLDVKILRFRTVLANPAFLMPPTNMTFSVNRRPAGGGAYLIRPEGVDTVQDSVLFVSGSGGIFAMMFPSGTSGRFVFDCAVTGPSQVKWLAGESFATASDVVSVIDSHAIFVVDVQANWEVGIEPILTGTAQATVDRCEVTKVS